MCENKHREFPALPPASAASTLRRAETLGVRPQYEQPGDEREEQWSKSLRGLQEWICELLIQNQELRMSLLDSATNHQSWEADR